MTQSLIIPVRSDQLANLVRAEFMDADAANPNPGYYLQVNVLPGGNAIEITQMPRRQDLPSSDSGVGQWSADNPPARYPSNVQLILLAAFITAAVVVLSVIAIMATSL